MGRTLTYNWSAKSFVVVVEKNNFFKVSQNVLTKAQLKKIVTDNHIKLFTDRSVVSALPAGWLKTLPKLFGAEKSH